MSRKSDGRETTVAVSHCAALVKLVEANCERTSKMEAATEMIYVILREQVKIDRERADGIAVAVAKLERQFKSDNINIPNKRRKLATRRHHSGKWRSGEVVCEASAKN